MTQNRELNQGDRLPEMFVDQIQEVTSTYVSPNFQLDLLNPTTLRLQAGTDNGVVGVMISGKWRYRSSLTTAPHPGGSAGAYDLYVTASGNSFANLGQTNESDTTNYAFGLQIKPVGQTPTTAVFRRVGGVYWNGVAITRYWVDGTQNDVIRTPVAAPVAGAVPSWDATNGAWVFGKVGRLQQAVTTRVSNPAALTDASFTTLGFTPSVGEEIDFLVSLGNLAADAKVWRLSYKGLTGGLPKWAPIGSPRLLWRVAPVTGVTLNSLGGPSSGAIASSVATFPAAGIYHIRARTYVTPQSGPNMQLNLNLRIAGGGAIVASADVLAFPITWVNGVGTTIRLGRTIECSDTTTIAAAGTGLDLYCAVNSSPDVATSIVTFAGGVGAFTSFYVIEICPVELG